LSLGVPGARGFLPLSVEVLIAIPASPLLTGFCIDGYQNGHLLWTSMKDFILSSNYHMQGIFDIFMTYPWGKFSRKKKCERVMQTLFVEDSLLKELLGQAVDDISKGRYNITSSTTDTAGGGRQEAP
jgi:hypothetical protein